MPLKNSPQPLNLLRRLLRRTSPSTPSQHAIAQGADVSALRIATTLSIENTFNNCCVAVLDSALTVVHNHEKTFHPTSGAIRQDSPEWNYELIRFHETELPILLAEARDALSRSERQLAFISLSIVKGRRYATVDAARRITAEFAADSINIREVDHLEAHVTSVRFCQPCPRFPYIAMLVAGGNCNLYVAESLGNYRLLGSHETAPRNRYGHGRAIGAVLDRCAVRLGIVEEDQPDGGIRIDQLSASKDYKDYCSFEQIREANANNGYEFDFHLAYEAIEDVLAREYARAQDTEFRTYLAVSMQHLLMSIVVEKTFNAAKELGITAVAFVGGVSASRQLRYLAGHHAEASGQTVYFAPREVCGDNALMIGALGLMENGFLTM